MNTNIKRRILLPVDGSKHSERAYQWYRDNLHRDGDLLMFVHIVEPTFTKAGHAVVSNSSTMTTDFTQELNKHVDKGKQLGERYIANAEEDNIKVEFTLHLGNKPGEHLVNKSRECQVDVIVIGNRGIGTMRRTFMGSVSDHVLHHAHIPVLVVPPPKDSK